MDNLIYIYFPLVSLFWGIYSFFDENDKEYIRRNGDIYSTDYYNGRPYVNHTSYRDYSRYNRQTSTNDNSSRYYANYNSRQYEGIAKKCERKFKISIAKDG